MASHSCQVAGCRFSKYHTTIAHRCGTCGKYGHGQIECKNESLKNALKQYYNDTLLKKYHCTIEGCRRPWSHSTKSHHCHKCGKNHS